MLDYCIRLLSAAKSVSNRHARRLKTDYSKIYHTIEDFTSISSVTVYIIIELLCSEPLERSLFSAYSAGMGSTCFVNTVNQNNANIDVLNGLIYSIHFHRVHSPNRV